MKKVLLLMLVFFVSSHVNAANYDANIKQVLLSNQIIPQQLVVVRNALLVHIF